MRPLIFSLLFCGVISLSSIVAALPVDATIVQLNGRSVKGRISARTEDQLQLLKGGISVPIRIGDIKSIKFNVQINIRKLSELKAERQHEQMIAILEPALKAYEEFADIPSSLTSFNTLLMELYYTVGQFDKTASIAAKMAQGTLDAELQEKAQVYHILALIESGQQDMAEALPSEYGWKTTESDASSAQLYITARLLAGKKQYTEALMSAAKVIALNDHDSDWMQPAELLCAELYFELGRYDSAEEVIRQILLLYKNTEIAEKAGQLKSRMEKLRVDRL